MTTMAYDFGTEIHVVELDEFDAATADGTTVLGTLSTGRDETLTDAGFHLVGQWTVHGEADGVEVRR
jgi:hypothetical protein